MSAPLFEQQLAPGVAFIGRVIELTGNGEFVVIESEGLARDVALVVPAADAEARFGQCAELLSAIAGACAQGASFDVGDTIRLGSALFDEYAALGFAPEHALPVSRKGGARMIGVPLLEDEAVCAERCGLPRVLARLGQAHKFFPYAPWIARGRAPVIKPADVAASPFASGMPSVGPLSAVVHDDVITIRPGPRAAKLMREALAARRPFLAATPVDDAHCGIAIVFDGAGKPPRGLVRGTLQAPAGLAFLVLTLGAEKRGANAIEDGIGVVLGDDDAARLADALASGGAFELHNPDAGRMPVVVEAPAA